MYSERVFEISFLFDRIFGFVVLRSGVCEASVGVSFGFIITARLYYSISMCILFIAHSICLCRYVFITVHVQRVGVCWCVCAIGAVLFLYHYIVCVLVDVVMDIRINVCARRIRVRSLINIIFFTLRCRLLNPPQVYLIFQSWFSITYLPIFLRFWLMFSLISFAKSAFCIEFMFCSHFIMFVCV